MQKFRVMFHFDKDNSRSFEIEGESAEILLQEITSHKDWYINEELPEAINMRLVTRISFSKPAKAVNIGF